MHRWRTRKCSCDPGASGSEPRYQPECIQPGGLGEKSGGQREFIEFLTRAAVAVGVAAVFLETHQDPDKAPSDGPNMIPLNKMDQLVNQLVKIDNLIKK